MVVVVLISMRVEILAAVRVRNISRNFMSSAVVERKKVHVCGGHETCGAEKTCGAAQTCGADSHTLLFIVRMGDGQRGYPENRINGGLCFRSGELMLPVRGDLFFVQATRLSRDGKKTSFMVPHRAVSFMLSCSLDGPSAHPPSCRDRDLIYIFALEIT